MKPVFVDTGALYAKYVARDQYHAQAIKIWQRVQRERQPCRTTNFVMAELISLLTYRCGSAAGLQAARDIYASHAVQVVSVQREHELGALQWLERFADQRLSMTDAVSFAVMAAERMTVAITFDHHFDIVGFTRYGD